MRTRSLAAVALVASSATSFLLMGGGCLGEDAPFTGAPGTPDGSLVPAPVDGSAVSTVDGVAVADADVAAVPVCPALPDPPGASWILGAGDTNDQFVRGIAVDTADNLVVGGNLVGTMTFVNAPSPLVSAGKTDAFVVGLDKEGRWRWGATFGDANEEQYLTALTESSGTTVVGLMFQGTVPLRYVDASVNAFAGDTPPQPDALVLRLRTADGVVTSHHVLTGPGAQVVNRIAQPTNGAAVIAGENAGRFDWPAGQVQGKGGFDALVGQVMSSANWIRDWGATNAGANSEATHQRIHAVALTGTGDVVVAGAFADKLVTNGPLLTSAGLEDAFINKLDAAGNQAGGWPKRYGDAGSQIVTHLVVAPNNDIIVAGKFTGTIDLGNGPLSSKGGTDIFLARLSPDGVHVFSKSFGGPTLDAPAGLALDACGDIVLGGVFDGTIDFGGGPKASQGKNDIFVAKLRGNDGTHVSTRTFGDAESQELSTLAVSPRTGDIVLGGWFRGSLSLGPGKAITSAGGFDAFVAKIPP